jgi:signal transduction histidine kinase
MNTISLPPISSPSTPISEIVTALERVGPLQGLELHEYEWLAKNGTEHLAKAGSILFEEGQPAGHMTIILKGEIHVQRKWGGPQALFIGRSGQITGLLPFSRMKSHGGQGTAVSDIWTLEFHRSLFPELLAAIPSFAQRVVNVLMDRIREVTRMEQQAEKLTALGKLAANLAHELNNPASAAQRAASGMLEELRTYGRQKFRLGALCLNDEQIAQVRAWDENVRKLRQHTPLIGITEREDQLLHWLSEHQISEPWRIAPELAEIGLGAECLDPLAEFLTPEAVGVVLSQLASSLRAESIGEAILDSTARIFDLISAVKAYSFMDQAAIQEIDVTQGLESTLQMLQSRLQHVEVVRDYQPDLPRISAYGSELNQIWMVLIENAVDAIQEKGTIRLSCHVSGDMMLTEVWDNGPGIDERAKDRIFEPFYTTKAPGKGLGLGLDTAMRVVRKHRGFLTVESKPGKTCFQVRLPLEQMQAF